MLKCISTAQTRAKCGPRFWAAAFFLKKSVKKCSLVKCWSAFRLRRLAQSVVLGSGAAFSWKFRIKWLFWNVDVHFDCAGSHKTSSAVLGSAFLLRISILSIILLNIIILHIILFLLDIIIIIHHLISLHIITLHLIILNIIIFLLLNIIILNIIIFLPLDIIILNISSSTSSSATLSSFSSSSSTFSSSTSSSSSFWT